LAACIASELKGSRKHSEVVDVGCGSGALMNYLRQTLPRLLPESGMTVTGFDVSDFAPHGNSNIGPGIRTVAVGEPWPYDDSSVDVVISNQVLEHVFDHRFFFSEVRRILKKDGVSVHLAPVRECLFDDHTKQPFAHKIRERRMAEKLIAFQSRLGFYNVENANALPKKPGQAFPEFAAAYLQKYCNYVTGKELMSIAQSCGLSGSFRYTPQFYTSKLRSLLHLPPRLTYGNTAAIDHLLYFFLRYVNCVTILVRPAVAR
jgi:SAM-dependent methyltransferase